MLDVALPDLTLSSMAYGSRGIPWDLRVFLYQGGADAHRSEVGKLIEDGRLGNPQASRLPFVVRIHEVISDHISRGASPKSLRSMLYCLSTFYAWLDGERRILTASSALEFYRDWTEHLLHRVQIEKSLGDLTAYRRAVWVGGLLSRSLRLHGQGGAALLRTTRLRKPKSRKRALGTVAEKQNLAETFTFGHFLTDLCHGLTVQAICGPTPLHITVLDNKTLLLRNKLRRPELDLSAFKPSERWNERKARASIAPGRAAERRPTLINLRIEAELLLFCAQTGINLEQARQQRREDFRYQTDGDDVLVRAYKDRRQGEVLFRAFRLYKSHFMTYLSWLDALIAIDDDSRLFPFIYIGTIPASHVGPAFEATKSRCATMGVTYIGPRALRRTRVNWLLRNTDDVDLTAQMSGHLRQTLLEVYEVPHHQRAATQIMRFHRATDPTRASAGPGICVTDERRAEPLDDIPLEAPRPDCISPDGCLFCAHHRDVDNADYRWRLASHRHIKSLELARFKPSDKPVQHPAAAVIDRINAKLNAMACSGETGARSVREAVDAVRAGRYHPSWDGFIQLLELHP